MLVLCACGVYKLDPENTNYVKNGKPMCSEWTCEKVKERRKDLERRQEVARAV